MLSDNSYKPFAENIYRIKHMLILLPHNHRVRGAAALEQTAFRLTWRSWMMRPRPQALSVLASALSMDVPLIACVAKKRLHNETGLYNTVHFGNKAGCRFLPSMQEQIGSK